MPGRDDVGPFVVLERHRMGLGQRSGRGAVP